MEGITEITYEVRVYETEIDYYNQKAIIADEYITNKQKALDMAKELSEHYFAVRVQSYGSDFIQLFAKKLFNTKNKFGGN